LIGSRVILFYLIFISFFEFISRKSQQQLAEILT
jgi:hypothetical protein